MPKHQPGMVIDLRVGERLALSVSSDPAGPGGAALSEVTVAAEHKSGSTVRLRVVAPPQVRIRRQRESAPSKVAPSMAG